MSLEHLFEGGRLRRTCTRPGPATLLGVALDLGFFVMDIDGVDAAKPHIFSTGSKPGDLMVQFGLSTVLEEMQKRKMRSSFANYVADLAGDIIPIKPRCGAGSLVEVARMPVNEDERKLELFDERVLRNALTLKESPHKPKLPDWLSEVSDDPQRKKRRDKKSRKQGKKKKRTGSDDMGDVMDRDDKRLRRKRRRKRDSEHRN